MTVGATNSNIFNNSNSNNNNNNNKRKRKYHIPFFQRGYYEDSSAIVRPVRFL